MRPIPAGPCCPSAFLFGYVTVPQVKMKYSPSVSLHVFLPAEFEPVLWCVFVCVLCSVHLCQVLVDAPCSNDGVGFYTPCYPPRGNVAKGENSTTTLTEGAALVNIYDGNSHTHTHTHTLVGKQTAQNNAATFFFLLVSFLIWGLQLSSWQ